MPTPLNHKLEEIKILIAEDEARHSDLHINEKLFGRKLAVGGYKRILEDVTIEPAEKLTAIYRIAVNLSILPKFNDGTDIHHKIREIAANSEPLQRKRETP